MDLQGVKRNFLRRTKATSPPDTTEAAATDNPDNTTNKYTRRGNSKFKLRKELEKNSQKNEIESRRPSLNGGSRLSERPLATRKFVSRRRLGGANSNSTTTVSSTTSVPVSSTTRRGFRIGARRRPSSTTTTTVPTTTTTVQPTTNSYEDEESLQEIGDTDAIEYPSLEPKTLKKIDKVPRRPLIQLKDEITDQNPSATNEEENKRQSKKYSASIKKNQLDELVKKSQEESSTESKTTVEDFSPETAVAIAAHNLLTAPIPSFNIFTDEGIKPTKKTPSTVEYKYASRGYNDYTESRTPAYDEYQTTASYKIGTLGNDETTAYKILEFDASRVTDAQSTKDTNLDSTKYDSDSTNAGKYDVTEFVDVPKTDSNRHFTTPQYKTEYVQNTAASTYTGDFDSSRISTYDVPKSTTFPNTANTNQNYIRTNVNNYDVDDDSRKITSTGFASKSFTTDSPTNQFTGQEFFRTTIKDLYDTRDDFDSKFSTYPRSNSYPANTETQNYIRSTTKTFPDTSTEYTSRNSPSYLPRFTSTDSFAATLTEFNLPKTATSLTPLSTSKTFDTTGTLLERSRGAGNFRTTDSIKVKGLRSDVSANVVTAGYSGVQRGGRFRNEKLIPVDEEGLATVRYSGLNKEPSYFTRDYLLESPVTKSYDEEYQYISPATTQQTPTSVTRKVFRKKIQRKISTTQRPTTPPPVSTPSSTVIPRRVPAKPFEKVSKEPKRKYRPIANYDYYDDSDEKMATKYAEGTKVVMHENGNIECLDIGNFPHPSSCKKFISCARIDNGSLLGWEYICPKGLSFDPVGGICNWSAGLGCNEKEA